MAFIVIEGGEGAGKTTQLALLKERLPKEFPGREFVFTKEPGGTPLADAIGDLIKSDGAKDASGRTMLDLFFAARFEHVEHFVRPALALGKVVVCDRFIAATYAYQLVGHDELELVPLYEAHLAQLKLKPERTVYLDIDPKRAQERVARRTGQPLTHYDTRELAFHERVRAGYRDWMEKYGEGACTLVDADASVEEVSERLIVALRPVLA
jgi:dTMP kinase